MGSETAGKRMDEFPNEFHPGQVIHHKLFGYRGVIVGVDLTFQLSDEWYDQVARSRPPKDKPWYHVVVDQALHMTYVAERHLELSDDHSPIQHPLLQRYFDRFRDGFYSNSRDEN